MVRPQFTLDLSAELIVDNFAGGGGASTGIELALGRANVPGLSAWYREDRKAAAV